MQVCLCACVGTLTGEVLKPRAKAWKAAQLIRVKTVCSKLASRDGE